MDDYRRLFCTFYANVLVTTSRRTTSKRNETRRDVTKQERRGYGGGRGSTNLLTRISRPGPPWLRRPRHARFRRPSIPGLDPPLNPRLSKNPTRWTLPRSTRLQILLAPRRLLGALDRGRVGLYLTGLSGKLFQHPWSRFERSGEVSFGLLTVQVEFGGFGPGRSRASGTFTCE